MAIERASITMCRVHGQAGLLLWLPAEGAIPNALRTPFIVGRWRSEVPVFVMADSGEMSVKAVDGWWLSARDSVSALAPLSLTLVDRLPASAAVWALAAKWVVEAVARQQVVPALDATDEPSLWRTRWRVAPVRPEDRSRLADLASAMPGVARAWRVAEPDRVLSATAALRSFMDAAADGLMRADTTETAPRPADGPAWAVRLGHALAGPDDDFQQQGLADRNLPSALNRWVGPATSLGGAGRPLVGFRLEEPKTTRGSWRLTYHLLDTTSAAQNVRVAVADLASGEEVALAAASHMSRPTETLIEALGRCVRVFAAIGRSLSEPLPSGADLDAAEAWEFLTRSALNLQRAGYWVDVPIALSRVGHRRVRARMRLGGNGPADGRGGILAGMVAFRWEASLGSDTLTAEEFRKLAASKAPLIFHRGQWIAVAPSDIERLRKLMDKGDGQIDAAGALRLALAGEVAMPGAPGATADVVGDGAVANALNVLRGGVSKDVPVGVPPAGLHGTLRTYQKRGLAWLQNVTSTGFGACLADDMGLGKTVQVLALLQDMVEAGDGKNFLVVCPTSVIGNWRREVRRFTPEMGVLIHHGPGRIADGRALQATLRDRGRQHYHDHRHRAAHTAGMVIITSYALVRRDLKTFKHVLFDALVLDEAQNIKNPEAAQSRAVRELRAHRRIALTGTPVENRLTELWSIMDVLNPGMLGSRSGFKKSFAVPVERYGDQEAAERLRRVTAPFILRRMKTDPNVVPDLPEKIETVRYCPLTREQAALYQSTLEASMTAISGMGQGMERRGRILAMLTGLKQICNHPMQYLRDGSDDPRRSGKTTRFLELLDEVFETGGHPLVFTQYREMGEVLRTIIERRTGEHVPFFHGGLLRIARDRMVARFQDPHGPPVMIVSLKAGGTGLNLTRANHVFHYDRWWNPAVEDQATDRAFRIGQTRDVTVHRLVCQGTLEEQIHQILEKKRSLADRVVGTGETWLSELDDTRLHELITLGQDAVLEEE